MITELQTQRLHLRQMKESDSLSMFKIWSDPDVTKFMNISKFIEKTNHIFRLVFISEITYIHEFCNVRIRPHLRQMKESDSLS
ncbi:hypothetical protein ACT453_31170, partial [Bacillus sp. D-CC]